MSKNMISFVEKSLEKSRAQDDALQALLTEMKGIRDEVKSDVKDVKEMVVEVRDRVHIEHEDQQILRSIVGKRSYAIAKDYYKNNGDYGAEIRELAGYAMRHHWKQLKEYFRVSRYTSIRHVDYEKAKEFVEGVVLDKSFLSEYEQWKYERAKKRERELRQVEKELN